MFCVMLSNEVVGIFVIWFLIGNELKLVVLFFMSCKFLKFS